MRSVVYRYDDLPRLHAALSASTAQALPVPPSAMVRDGEWVLALFEFESTSRATAAAGRGALLDDGTALVFERRDWERLRDFASARSDSSARVPAVSGERPSAPREPQPAAESLRSTRPRETSAPELSTELSADLSRTDESAVPVMSVRPPPPPPRLRGEGSRVMLVDDDLELR